MLRTSISVTFTILSCLIAFSVLGLQSAAAQEEDDEVALLRFFLGEGLAVYETFLGTVFIEPPPPPEAEIPIFKELPKQIEQFRKEFDRFVRKLKEHNLDSWDKWLAYDTDGDGKLSRDELTAMLKEKISCGKLFDILTCEQRDNLIEKILDRLLCGNELSDWLEGGNYCKEKFFTADKFKNTLDNTIRAMEDLIANLDCSVFANPRNRANCEKIVALQKKLLEKIKKLREDMKFSAIASELDQDWAEQ